MIVRILRLWMLVRRWYRQRAPRAAIRLNANGSKWGIGKKADV